LVVIEIRRARDGTEEVFGSSGGSVEPQDVSHTVLPLVVGEPDETRVDRLALETDGGRARVRHRPAGARTIRARSAAGNRPVPGAARRTTASARTAPGRSWGTLAADGPGTAEHSGENRYCTKSESAWPDPWIASARPWQPTDVVTHILDYSRSGTRRSTIAAPPL